MNVKAQGSLWTKEAEERKKKKTAENGSKMAEVSTRSKNS